MRNSKGQSEACAVIASSINLHTVVCVMTIEVDGIL